MEKILNKTRDKKTCYVSGCSGASYKVTKLASNSEQIPGTLAHPESEQSFFRLVRCTYFRKHKAGFLPMYQTTCIPFALKGQTPLDQRRAWLQLLRERMWSRIKYEEMISSDNALANRSCWVLSTWKLASSNNIDYPPLNGNGWKQTHSCSKLTTIVTLTFVKCLQGKHWGCGCKTVCMTNWCKCRKTGNVAQAMHAYVVATYKQEQAQNK